MRHRAGELKNGELRDISQFYNAVLELNPQ